MFILRFDTGTLVLEVPKTARDEVPKLLPSYLWDPRIEAYRAPALAYRKTIGQLTRAKIDFNDQARTYGELNLEFTRDRRPFYYQQEALDAWESNGGSGVVVLPTGAGKTFVAQLAMQRKQRAALIITPTLDLLTQWSLGIEHVFGIECGVIGGGSYDLKDITVTTYDSAYIHMERIGNRFGLLIFDEVHHLLGPSYALAAQHAIAPFRLGLTATPEREAVFSYAQLIGPVIYEQGIRELVGENLATYEVVPYEVELDDDERQAYDEQRGYYLQFIREMQIRLGTANGWREFLRLSSRSPQGRRALRAHRAQREITQQCRAKMALLAEILAQHRSDRSIIFTADNASVYKISERFLIPAITHHSNVKERRHILEGFSQGLYPAIVTSRVLNEGVDMPAANVAIVLSGSGSVREHVQRLGRILRAAENKSAVLYEIIAKGTNEESTSKRRRKHEAF